MKTKVKVESNIEPNFNLEENEKTITNLSAKNRDSDNCYGNFVCGEINNNRYLKVSKSSGRIATSLIERQIKSTKKRQLAVLSG